MRAFADALDAVPMALAENSGLSPIETLASIKSRQVKEKNSKLGVDCMQTGSNGMLRTLPIGAWFFLLNVLTSCSRHARTFHHRSPDWKTSTASARNSTVSDGLEGMASDRRWVNNSNQVDLLGEPSHYRGKR